MYTDYGNLKSTPDSVSRFTVPTSEKSMVLYTKFKKAIYYFLFSRLHKKSVKLELKEPIISFTFDDIPRSAIQNGQRILNKYNYSGTYYIALGLMEEEGFDFHHDEDVKALKQIISEGGELGCHTYSHLHFFDARQQEIISDLRRNSNALEEIIPGYRFQNFSYPFGEQSLNGRKIVKGAFRSARSVYKGVNLDRTDLNCLKSIRLYQSIDLTKIFMLIDKVIEEKAWMIFYTHDVQENPTEAGCTPEYFEQVVKYCAEKKLKVLTINNALDYIQ